MPILNAKESSDVVFRANIVKAHLILDKINTVHPKVMEDIAMHIRETAVRGFSQANIEVSKYIGTYWIGTIKYCLQLLGYDVSYHSSTEELIVIWK